MAVRKGDGLIRHLHAPGGGTDLAALGHLGGGQPPAGPGVDDLTVAAVGCAGRMQLATAAKTGIHQPAAVQNIVVMLVNFCPLTLVDRQLRTVGGKAQPGQIVDDGISKHTGAALGVQVLDAQ